MKAIAPVTTKADVSVYEILRDLIQLLRGAAGVDQTALADITHRLGMLRSQLEEQ